MTVNRPPPTVIVRGLRILLDQDQSQAQFAQLREEFLDFDVDLDLFWSQHRSHHRTLSTLPPPHCHTDVNNQKKAWPTSSWIMFSPARVLIPTHSRSKVKGSGQRSISLATTLCFWGSFRRPRSKVKGSGTPDFGGSLRHPRSKVKGSFLGAHAPPLPAFGGSLFWKRRLARSPRSAP